MTDRETLTSIRDEHEDTFKYKAQINGETSLITDLMQNDEIKSRLDLIDTEIKRHLIENQGEPQELYETAYHLLYAGGKRLRSLLVILACEAVEGDINKVLPVAIATEFAQTASLIHDDIIDEDKVRRGVETVHSKFGQKMAILAGDLLITQSIRLLGKHAAPEILVQIAKSGIELCEGQAADLLMSADNPEMLTENKYLDMIEKKTVSFIKTTVMMGAFVAGANEEQQQALSKYGENIGFAFQIRDDILNVISPQHVTGKSMLSDISRKRCTYPLIRAFEISPKEKQEKCLKALVEADLDYILALIEETDSIRHSTELANTYVEKAKAAITGMDFKNEDILFKVADFILHRIH